MSASAQLEALERVMMPGPVISGHAEFESECTNCHARFSRAEQRDLCVACHTEIGQDLQTGTGFHSLSPDVAGQNCASCHTEHAGRDADVVGLVPEEFDHALTDFMLRDSHIEAKCEDCHTPDEPFHPVATTCVSCHLEDDTHMGNLGEDCQDCHRETEWADAFYDHEVESGYALTGAHAEVTCASCHIDEVYVDTPTECVGCHRDDDDHMGNNGIECQDCHTTNDWAETLFDHFARTGFALSGSHAGVECDSCHEGNNKLLQKPSSECYSCHREDDHHDGINGTVCNDCHRATEWLDVSFDHDVDTDFPLNGAHAQIECADCHVEQIAVALPDTECIGCHTEDEPHEGQLGTDCASCHAEVHWDEGVRFDHDLAAFPLLGQHALNQCEDCHETPAFHDASEVCVDCHMEDDAHEARLGSDCAACHTPLDWLLWTFDHAEQTDFPLDGAHDGLQCESCHKTPVADGSIAVSMTCISCHRGDDVHRGRYGTDCAECHTSESFDALRVTQ
jgi:hypothetical protein